MNPAGRANFFKELRERMFWACHSVSFLLIRADHRHLHIPLIAQARETVRADRECVPIDHTAGVLAVGPDPVAEEVVEFAHRGVRSFT
jgi:hypothetical protein